MNICKIWSKYPTNFQHVINELNKNAQNVSLSDRVAGVNAGLTHNLLQSPIDDVSSFDNIVNPNAPNIKQIISFGRNYGRRYSPQYLTPYLAQYWANHQ